MSDKRLPDNTNIQGDDDLGQIILTLDDDSEMTCDIIAMYPCSNGKNYVALLPVDDPDSDFLLYRYTATDDGEDLVLEDIEDDDEFDEASDAFDELMDTADFEEMFGEDDEN